VSGRCGAACRMHGLSSMCSASRCSAAGYIGCWLGKRKPRVPSRSSPRPRPAARCAIRKRPKHEILTRFKAATTPAPPCVLYVCVCVVFVVCWDAPICYLLSAIKYQVAGSSSGVTGHFYAGLGDSRARGWVGGGSGGGGGVCVWGGGSC
jgi:hypothetical protein